MPVSLLRERSSRTVMTPRRTRDSICLRFVTSPIWAISMAPVWLVMAITYMPGCSWLTGMTG
ncbi:hypothetical protein D3C72_2172170 [compost metagenome]